MPVSDFVGTINYRQQTSKTYPQANLDKGLSSSWVLDTGAITLHCTWRPLTDIKQGPTAMHTEFL